jgi:hypothetical protein
MNTSKHIASKTAQEFKVQLKGAYQGNYRVLLVCCDQNKQTETFVFTDTQKPIHIHNTDILNLVLETITKSNHES